MTFPARKLLTPALIGAGALAWGLAAPPLAYNPDLQQPLNILGINSSPYGELFAMAMQGPIDTTFHHGADTRNPHAADPAPSHDRREKKSFRSFLDHLATSSSARTNPRPPSPAHDRHIRRQVENQLKFAYHLDPSHYGNYASYHFFLTEPAIGTRTATTPLAVELAEQTIAYCLREPHDPRPALTAAAAATHLLDMMFQDRRSSPQPTFSIDQMKQALATLDHCIARHHQLARQWKAAGHHKFLSPSRLNEMEDRLEFMTNIREAAAATIQRLVLDSTLSHPTG
jgi:hypothetical protein